MDTGLLEDIIALLEAGSLNRAAARRNVTQPAFSRRVRAFEDWIGRPLLERGTNHITMHPALSENEGEIRAILLRLSELRETVASHDGNAQRLTVVAQHALSAGSFPEICRSLVNQQPHLTFRLRTCNRKECISTFLRDEADVLLCYQAPDFPPMPFDQEIYARLWREDCLAPIVSRSLLDTAGSGDDVVLKLPRIAYPAESHFGRLIAEQGKRHPLSRLVGPVVVTSAFSNGVLELVRSRLGVGWVPLSLAAEHLRSGEVCTLREQIGRISVGVTLYALRSNKIGCDLLETVQPADQGKVV